MAKERKAREPQTDAEKEAKREFRVARKKAREVLLSYASQAPKEVAAAIDTLCARRASAPSSGRRNLERQIMDIFTKHKGTVHEDLFYKAVKLGRVGMGRILRNFVVKREPESRVWVDHSDDPANNERTYLIRGTGPNPPKGWDGVLPKEEKEEEEA